MAALLEDPGILTLQIRLVDRFGDNGIIGIVIGRKNGDGDINLDTWLMSCRVIGRGVEKATLNLIVAEARRLGAVRLIGQYQPTSKNGMVAEHYPSLGFRKREELASPEDDFRSWELALDTFTEHKAWIEMRKS